MSLDAIQYAWPEILIRAKAALPPVAVLLEGLRPQAFDAGRLAVALAPAVADQVAALTPDRLAGLASAVEKETGLDVLVVSLEFAEAGTAPPEPEPALPTPPKESKPEPEPDPEPKPAKEPKPKATKAAKARDPLADMEGEQIRYNLIIQPPPDMAHKKMLPWWERRPYREKMVKERRAARAKAEAEEAEKVPAKNETLVQIEPAVIELRRRDSE